MKISEEWLREFVTGSIDIQTIAQTLTSTGLEVESVTAIETVPGNLQGVVVGCVVECMQHPDADRLKLTKVDVGGGDLLQIVCGASNVAQGQKVLVATVGAKLYTTEGEPLVIKKGKIRGQESHGMICAEDELGIGTSHAGILILPENTTIGMPAAEALGLSADHCIEIGLTPNRTDAISHLGVARDLVAALLAQNRTDIQFHAPVYPEIQPTSVPVNIEIENADDCPRYSGAIFSNLKIGPSPDWLQKRLKAIGVRPVNNIVDITNYVQHEIGQPLHAFDLDFLEQKKLQIRRAANGEDLITLDGISRKLRDSDLVITDGNKPVCLAGVFGGIDSGVKETTVSIFLESAHFNASAVRRTARNHGLNTDASFRFERGSNPDAVPHALQRAAQLIAQIIPESMCKGMQDHYVKKIEPAQIIYHFQDAERLIGLEIPKDIIKRILHSLEFEILTENRDHLALKVPLYRTDVTTQADVVEEVLRIYGYDRIPFPKALKTSLTPYLGLNREKVRSTITRNLVGSGYTEIMSLSMTKEKYAQQFESVFPQEKTIRLKNALSSDLALMRTTLLFGGLESIALNVNHRNNALRLFETGRAYSRNDEGITETEYVGIWLTGRREMESWNNAPRENNFQDLLATIENITKVAGLKLQMNPLEEHPIFSGGLFWSAGPQTVIAAGLVKSEILDSLEIAQPVYYAEIDFDLLFKFLPKSSIVYKEPSKYPSVRRDLSLTLDKAVSFAHIKKIALETEKKSIVDIALFDVYEGKNLPEGKKSYAVSFILQDESKTMNDHQVNGIMERIQKSLSEKLGAELRT